MRLGINGMGRIGRLALRAALGGAARPQEDPHVQKRAQVVHLNEIQGGVEVAAHLLAFDSVQGRWRAAMAPCGAAALQINDDTLGWSAYARPGDIPWADYGVDVVLECTGKFLSPETLQGHLDRGAKRVIVAAPVKSPEVLNVVYGVNHHDYDPARHSMVTAASCTTNCLAPIVKVIHESLGIRHGQITTLHDPTNTNRVVDAPHRDLRRARSALLSLAPTTTGSATAIGLIYPALQGKLNGHAVRVPVLNASLTDCVFELARPTDVSEVHGLFAEAARGPLAGILGFEERPLVSADYAGDTRSSIVDALSTLVTDGTLLKVYAWYDNEMAYACRMLDLAWYMEQSGL